MSLEHAILGFLSYQSFSGYDLKKVFDTSVRHFWPADQSQIYRTLGRMADRGWAELEVVEQSDRPDRKVYHISQSGREELRRWLVSPPPIEEPRSAPLVQVFFAGQLTDGEILSKFEGAAAVMRALLDRYDQIPQQIDACADMVDSPREVFFWMLTLELGIRIAQTQLEWAESVIQRIRDGQHPAQ